MQISSVLRRDWRTLTVFLLVREYRPLASNLHRYWLAQLSLGYSLPIEQELYRSIDYGINFTYLFLLHHLFRNNGTSFVRLSLIVPVTV